MKRQYTIRAVPDSVDEALRREARQTGNSLNEVALAALRRGAGLDQPEPLHDDLDHLIGTWVEDPEFDQAIEDQRRIDPKLWR